MPECYEQPALDQLMHSDKKMLNNFVTLSMRRLILGATFFAGVACAEETTLHTLEEMSEKWLSSIQAEKGRLLTNDQPLPGEIVDAVKLVRQQAEQGNADAQFLLGVMYASGEGVSEDKEEAAKWFRKVAELGNSNVQLLLGLAYLKGEGVNEDKSEAVKWIRKAAHQGNSAAQFTLGLMYAEGEGVNEDKLEALKWFIKAAD